MAEPLTDDTLVKRCAVCLTALTFPKRAEPSLRVQCPSCKGIFDVGEALPLIGESGPATVTRAEPAATSWQTQVGAWLVAIPAMVAAVAWITWYGQRLNGPDFLTIYIIVFAVTLVGSWTALYWRDDWAVSIAAFAVFEGVGLFRLYLGYQAGMRRFGFMIAMMVIGGLVYFLRAKSDGNGVGLFGSCAGGSSCSTSSMSSCGSSCGGGCGGGGCGGCGG